MFHNIEEYVDYISHRMAKGRFGLDHFKQAMESLADPQYKIPCIHIAGTNGKGSTTNYLRSVLQQAGYKVGTFTSPHLEVHNDRIRINDVFIDDKSLLRYGNRYHKLIEAYNLSMFEIDMLTAVTYFTENNVDVALYEVGLGGRLDATNIVSPWLSLITNIGFDHMEYLGNTLPEIAFEKAGIIKENSMVIVGEKKPECLNVFTTISRERNCELRVTDEATNIVHEQSQIRFTYRNRTVTLDTLALYQVNNASLVLDAIDAINEKEWLQISEPAILEGMRSAKWKGRFEVMSKDPLIIIDGAHNEHGMEAFVQSAQILPRPIITVFTALKDKETDKMMKKLLTLSDEVIVTEFDYYRAAKAVDLAKDLDVKVITDPMAAIRYGMQRQTSGTLLITGSLYFITDVRQRYLPELLKEK